MPARLCPPVWWRGNSKLRSRCLGQLAWARPRAVKGKGRWWWWTETGPMFLQHYVWLRPRPLQSEGFGLMRRRYCSQSGGLSCHTHNILSLSLSLSNLSPFFSDSHTHTYYLSLPCQLCLSFTFSHSHSYTSFTPLSCSLSLILKGHIHIELWFFLFFFVSHSFSLSICLSLSHTCIHNRLFWVVHLLSCTHTKNTHTLTVVLFSGLGSLCV